MDREKISTTAILSIALIVGIWMRFIYLEQIPGFEHDEALICLGAQSVFESLPLTGDKAYEGPLLEYLLGSLMCITGPDLMAVRYFMACAGVLSILLYFFAGRLIAGPLGGVIIALIVSTLPWHIAASRVIYACNLSSVFIPAFIICTLKYMDKNRVLWLAAASLSLGLAANGRASALILLLPLLILVYKSSRTHLLWVPIITLLPLFSVVIYNAASGWPALSILKGSGQGFLVASDSISNLTYWDRLVGFAATLKSVLASRLIWIDAAQTRFKLLDILPVALCLACVFGLWIHWKNRKAQWMFTSSAILFAVLPLITKVRSPNNVWTMFHAHYMDLLLPFVLLVPLWGLKSKKPLTSKTSWLFVGFSFCAFIAQIYISIGIMGPALIERHGLGRWHPGFVQAAQRIQKLNIPDTTEIITSFQFESGFPQMSFLLQEFKVNPVLIREFNPKNLNAKTLPQTKLYIGYDFEKVPEDWKLAFTIPISGKRNISAWIYESPHIHISGFIRNSKSFIQVKLDIHSLEGELNGEGEVSFRSEKISFGIADVKSTFSTNTGLMNKVSLVTPRHKQMLAELAQQLETFEIAFIEGSRVKSIKFFNDQGIWSCSLIFSEENKVVGLFEGELIIY